jgi:hypothetical protein
VLVARGGAVSGDGHMTPNWLHNGVTAATSVVKNASFDSRLQCMLEFRLADCQTEHAGNRISSTSSLLCSCQLIRNVYPLT